MIFFTIWRWYLQNKWFSVGPCQYTETNIPSVSEFLTNTDTLPPFYFEPIPGKGKITDILLIIGYTR